LRPHHAVHNEKQHRRKKKRGLPATMATNKKQQSPLTFVARSTPPPQRQPSEASTCQVLYLASLPWIGTLFRQR